MKVTTETSRAHSI